MLSKFLRLWAGPLPEKELYPEISPNVIKHWLYHPLKRHLARFYLKILQKIFKLKVIAVGGTNGKTTTRNFLLTLLPHSQATFDSITSTYNIPSSILKLKPWTKYFICEMSVEYIGDMDFYLWLAKPDLAIVTLIELEHTQFLGSLDTVAQEENKLTRGKWTKIINGNSPQIASQGVSTFTYGTSEKFDCFIKSTKLTKDFTTKINLVLSASNLDFELPAIGRHLAHHLAAALLTASTLGLEIRNLKLVIEQHFAPAPHRLNLIHHKSGAIFIDDTYNSNPSSAKASIETAVELAKLSHRDLVVVLSQMNELGPYETSEHQRLKALISKFEIRNSNLFSIGPAAKSIGRNFTNQKELLSALKGITLNSKHLVLFKSSRSWRLEEVLVKL